MQTRWIVLIIMWVLGLLGFIKILRDDTGGWGSGLYAMMYLMTVVPALITATILMAVL